MEVRGSNSLWRSYLLVRAWKQGPQTVDRFQNDFLRITEKNRFGVMLQSPESQIEFQQCKEGIFCQSRRERSHEYLLAAQQTAAEPFAG